MNMLILLSLLIPSMVFGATVSIDETRQNSKDQTVFFTVTHNEVSYEYHADIPLSADPVTHIQSQADEYMVQIYREMYRRAPRNLRSIFQWESWIANGATIILPNGSLKVVNKESYKGKHPEFIQLKKNLDAATSIQERVIILENYILDQ